MTVRRPGVWPGALGASEDSSRRIPGLGRLTGLEEVHSSSSPAPRLPVACEPSSTRGRARSQESGHPGRVAAAAVTVMGLPTDGRLPGPGSGRAVGQTVNGIVEDRTVNLNGPGCSKHTMMTTWQD